MEFLSKPEIDFGDNNGYVTVKIRAACIGSDGKPVTNVKLEKEFESYEVNEDRYDLVMALDSFRFVLLSLIAEIDTDTYLNEFLYHFESSRNTLFFHYVLLRRRWQGSTLNILLESVGLQNPWMRLSRRCITSSMVMNPWKNRQSCSRMP